MKLVSRHLILNMSSEANEYPANLNVVGVGFIRAANKVKVYCKSCGHQTAESRGDGRYVYNGYIDVDELLKKASPAKNYAYMLVVPVEKIRQLPHLTEYKCSYCNKVNLA
jgi:hypothetical protein